MHVAITRLSLLLAVAWAAPAAAQAPLETPDADEYAVWSAVIDAQASPGPWRLLLPDSITFSRVADEKDRQIIEWLMSAEIADSLEARALRPARIDARRLRVRRVRFVPREEAGTETRSVSFSRVAFDAERRNALVGVSFFCGIVCGYGGLVRLEERRNGRWRVAGYLTMLHY